MNVVDTFLYVSVIAHYSALFFPKPLLKDFPWILEKIGLGLEATLLLLALILESRYLFGFMSIFYAVSGLLNCFGYSKWNVQWKNEVSDVIQAFFATWDLLIAICCLIRF